MLMVLKGELVEMMVQIAPQVYRKYMTVDRKGTPIICQALEGTVWFDEGKPTLIGSCGRKWKNMGSRSTHTIPAWQIKRLRVGNN